MLCDLYAIETERNSELTTVPEIFLPFGCHDAGINNGIVARRMGGVHERILRGVPEVL